MRCPGLVAGLFLLTTSFIAPWAGALPAPPGKPPAAQQPAASASVFEGAPRVVAIGDIHGDFEKFTTVLRLCKVTDDSLHWVAGAAHLVQTGDVLDRGPDSKKVMDLLMQLEAQAAKAGGHVHALIGNHEYMTMAGDLRYVSDGELAAFGDGARSTPVGAEPIGTFPHYRAAFAPNGPYGRWIVSHNAIVKVNGTLFMHGGLSPRYQGRDIAQLNDFIRAELRGERDRASGVGADPEGPLWFRGLSETVAPPGLGAFLQQLLAMQKARRIVVGHTIQEHGIVLRENGQLALIDVGMSRKALNGAASCLVIEPPTDAGGADRLSIVR